jgi:acyl-coenzyme A synthetase/AMP-(fatty) acid ligase
VRKDADGFHFRRRRDEMIKTSGYRVSPTEIEEQLGATQLVGESRRWRLATLGQSIVVVASPKDGARSTPTRCSPNANPPAGLHGPQSNRRSSRPLPRNPNGKIDRDACLLPRWRRTIERHKDRDSSMTLPTCGDAPMAGGRA